MDKLKRLVASENLENSDVKLLISVPVRIAAIRSLLNNSVCSSVVPPKRITRDRAFSNSLLIPTMPRRATPVAIVPMTFRALPILTMDFSVVFVDAPSFFIERCSFSTG